MEHFFKGYCKFNNYNVNLIMEYIDEDKKLIGATTFYSKQLKSDFILFNFNAIPLLKSYYYTLMKYYLLGNIDSVWNSIFSINSHVEKAKYNTNFENKNIIYNDVWDDNDKNSLTNFLTFISVQFLMNHEVAHCLNGHTRFLDSGTVNDYLAVNKISKSKLIKTMEMDADAYAAGSLANYINNFKYEDLCTIFPCLDKMSKTDISTLCVFAILSTFMCSAEYASNSNNYFSPLMRAVLSIDVLLTEFKLLNEIKDKEKYNNLIIMAYENYAKIFDKDIIDFAKINSLMKEDIEYKNELRQLWVESLRNELSCYAIEELAK